MALKSSLRGVAIALAIVTSGLTAPAQAQSEGASSTPSAKQATSQQAGSQQDEATRGVDKRVFGVLPNYRTANLTADYHPLTAKQKMVIGLKDSFDYPNYILSAAFAGLNQLENSDPEFGQGMKGYGKRFAGAVADQSIGNLMTESLFPIMLRQDPRYFRKGTGTGWSRVGYAVSRVLITKSDQGKTQFNFSEVVGNSVAVGISNLYYPGSRNVGDNLNKLGTQIAVDAISQVLKEFWPDVKKRLFKKRYQQQQQSAMAFSH